MSHDLRSALLATTIAVALFALPGCAASSGTDAGPGPDQAAPEPAACEPIPAGDSEIEASASSPSLESIGLAALVDTDLFCIYDAGAPDAGGVATGNLVGANPDPAAAEAYVAEALSTLSGAGCTVNDRSDASASVHSAGCGDSVVVVTYVPELTEEYADGYALPGVVAGDPFLMVAFNVLS